MQYNLIGFIQTHKHWSFVFISIVALVFITVGILNYLLDPFWCFSRGNIDNFSATIIDQREQKTNRLLFEGKKYDSLILGSSRTEPVDQGSLGNCRAFNYAAPAMYPEEYEGYLSNFSRINQKSPKNIFIGFDFFGTIETKPVANKPAEAYFLKSSEKLYRFRTLLNPDTLRVFLKCKFNRKYYYRYDRVSNVLIPKDLSRYDANKLLSDRLFVFKENFYADKSYRYDPSFTKIIGRLKEQNPGSNFIIFTTPVTRPLFELLVREGRFEDYCRWIGDLVEVFGSVYNFMSVNSITENPGNYYDADHFFPKIGTLIAHRITAVPDDNIPDDFGILVTRQNITEHLRYLAGQAREISDN